MGRFGNRVYGCMQALCVCNGVCSCNYTKERESDLAGV